MIAFTTDLYIDWSFSVCGTILNAALRQTAFCYWSNEIFDSIAQIKIMSREDTFNEKYQNAFCGNIDMSFSERVKRKQSGSELRAKAGQTYSFKF